MSGTVTWDQEETSNIITAQVALESACAAVHFQPCSPVVKSVSSELV